MATTNKDEPTPDEWRATAEANYRATLIMRYKTGLPLTVADKRLARRLIALSEGTQS